MAALLAWKDEYKTGLPGVDHDHEELIVAINRFLGRISDNADGEEVQFHLGEIHSLIESHFALEERIMRDRGYADYQEHKTDHDRLLDEIRDIMDGVGVDEAFPYAPELADRMGRWFSVHFGTQDRKLHRLIGD